MFDALVAKKVVTSLVMFQGEQHGFRSQENIIQAIDNEYVFYSTVLGFPLSKQDQAMNQPPIQNLPE